MTALPHIPLATVSATPTPNSDLPVTNFPSLKRIAITDTVGPLASNMQDQSLEKRDEYLRSYIVNLVDIANVLDTFFLRRDGSAQEDAVAGMTANMPMNSHKLTGLAVGSMAGDSVEYAQMNTAVSTAVAAEASLRSAADVVLQNNINSEASTRTTNDNTLQTNINNEATSRATGDTNTLASAHSYTDSAISTEVTNRNSAITSAVSAEASTRATADTTLQGNITTEASARAAADTTLTNSKVAKSGDSMTGSLTMTSGATVTGIPSPANPSDAVPLSYLASASVDYAVTAGTATYATSAGAAATSTTQSVGDNTTNIATTAYVQANIGPAVVTTAEIGSGPILGYVKPVGSSIPHADIYCKAVLTLAASQTVGLVDPNYSNAGDGFPGAALPALPGQRLTIDFLNTNGATFGTWNLAIGGSQIGGAGLNPGPSPGSFHNLAGGLPATITSSAIGYIRLVFIAVTASTPSPSGSFSTTKTYWMLIYVATD